VIRPWKNLMLAKLPSQKGLLKFLFPLTGEFSANSRNNDLCTSPHPLLNKSAIRSISIQAKTSPPQFDTLRSGYHQNRPKMEPLISFPFNSSHSIQAETPALSRNLTSPSLILYNRPWPKVNQIFSRPP